MAGRYSGCKRWLTLACWIPMLALAQTQPVVQVRTTAQEGTEPKFIQEGDHIGGLCIELMRAIELLDPGLRFIGDQRWKPLIRAFSELENGVEDVQCAVQRTPTRERRFNYIGPPLYSIEYHFLVRADDRITINSWDDVRKLAPNNVVLVSRGFAASEIVAATGGIEVDASSTQQELNLQKLLAGRGRLYFHRTPGLHKLLERTGTTDKIRILPQVMYSAKLYFAASKRLDKRVSDRIANALYTLEKRGDLERMIRKWD